MSIAAEKRKFPTAPVAIAFFAVYCFAWLFAPPCYNGHSYLASIIDKHNALEKAHSPKIVFVGGSNLALGLDSAALSKATGEDVVNMGVSRLFGLRYCLEEVKDFIHPDDTIVVVPEYENFYGEMNGSSHLMNVPLMMPQAIPWVWRAYATSPKRIGDLGSDLVGVLTFKWSWWRKHSLEYLKHPNCPLSAKNLFNPAEPDNFTRENFTASGDFVGHLNAKPPALKYFKFCDGLSANLDPSPAGVLNSFASFARTHGARVVLMPPPLPRQVYREHKKEVESVYQFCLQNLDFPVIAAPERYLFASKDFYNSLYHLNGAGRERRTDLVLQDLESHAQVASRAHPEPLRL